MPTQRSNGRGKAKANPARAGKKQTTSRRTADGLELGLPAGFTSDGARMATLREVLNPAVPTRSMLQLSQDRWLDVAARRVQLRPADFSLVIPLHGKIGRERAVAEIRSRTRIGLHLAEIEKTMVTQSSALWSTPRKRI
jgi:hypothetical protein